MAAAYPIPSDPEQLERWQRDPGAYEAVERLQDAAEALIAAVDEQANATGLLLWAMYEPYRTAVAEKGGLLPTPELLVKARQQVDAAQARWAAAVSAAEALLHDRQEGGE